MAQQVTLTISAEDSASGVLAKVAAGLDSLNKKTEETVQKSVGVSQGFKGLGTSAQQLEESIRGLLTPANLFGAVVGGTMLIGIKSAISETSAYSAELRSLANITGASTAELAELNQATNDLGIGAGSLQRGLFLMSREIESGGQALKKLGLSIRESGGGIKNETQLLYEVSDALSGMSDKSLAANRAREIFGRGAATLLPLLQAGSAHLKELGNDAKKFGTDLDDVANNKIKQFDIELHNVEDAFLGVKLTIIQDLLPAILPLVTGFIDLVALFQKIPAPLRQIGEVVVFVAASIVALSVAIKVLKATLLAPWIVETITTLGAMVLALNPATLAIGAVSLAVAGLIAFDVGGLRSKFVDLGSSIVESMKSAGSSIKELFSSVFSGPSVLGPPDPTAEERDAAFLARRKEIVEMIAKQAANTEKTVAELQHELQVETKLATARIDFAKATQSTYDAQITQIKEQTALKLAQVDIELKQIKLTEQTAVEFHKIEREKILIIQASTAEIAKVRSQETIAEISRQTEIQKVRITTFEAGAVAIRDQAALEIKTAQDTYEAKRSQLAKVLPDQKAVNAALIEDAKVRDKTIQIAELNQFKQLRDLHIDYVKEFLTIEQSKITAKTEADKQSTEIALKELDIEQKARQNTFDAGVLSLNDLVDAEQKAADKRAAIQLVSFAKEKSSLLQIAEEKKKALETEFGLSGKNDPAKLGQETIKNEVDTQKQLQAIDAKAEGVKQARREKDMDLTKQSEAEKIRILDRAADQQIKLSDDTAQKILADNNSSVQDRMRAEAALFENRKKQYDKDVQTAVDSQAKKTNLYQSETDKQLAIEAGEFVLEKNLYDVNVQNYINARLKETGYLKDALTKRLTEEAGYINAVEQLRQKLIADTSTALTEQARQTGDLGAAFQVGFAQAASSADDAFIAMKKAGADTYQSLKSGLSDFLFDVFTGAKNISDIFVNLGKRILRSFTDVFAEIIAKQALMAAGFSLPALLGSAGTVIAATAGFEGAPNQTATAVQQLGTSATTASQALGSMTGMTGAVIQIFAFLTAGVGKFIGFLSSILQTAGLSSGTAGGLAQLVAGGGLSFGLGSLIFGNGSGGLGSGLGGTLGTGLGLLLPELGTDILGSVLSTGLQSMLIDLVGPLLDTITGLVLPGLGFVIGGLIGNIFGGLFSGPTPEISGKVQLNSTNIQALLAATRAVPFSSGPGPNEVNNPPGRSNFSFLDTGPLHSELFKHRTQGTLSREESQLDIQNVILATLQAAVKGLSQLGSRLPTEALSKALSTRIDAVLAKGFDIVSFDFEGDVEDVVKNFQDFLKGLSGQALTAFTTELFPSIDLTALGAGDAAKGFDVLASSLAGFSNLLVKSGHATVFAGDSIDQFATRSVDFFTQFTKDGEALADTIKRVSQEVGQMIDQLNAFHVSTDQFLLGLQTRISTLSLQSGGGLREFNLLRDVAPRIIGAFSRDVQLQFLDPLIASLKEQALAAIDVNAPIGDVLAGRRQIVGFGAGLFQSLQGEADPIKAIQGLQVLAKGVEDLLAGEIEGAKAYYAKQVALAQAAADARIAQLEEEKKAIQLNTSAIEAQITAAEAHISQLEEEKRGIQDSTKGLEDQIRAIEDLGQARIAPLQEEQRLLQDQLSILQQQAQTVQAWKGVLDSVTKQLTDMRLSSLNPKNALERLGIAQQLVVQAKAKFASEGTPEAATSLQQALSDELKIAQEAFQRPSSAYQRIFDQVSVDLQNIQSVSGAHTADLAHLTQEIAARQAHIETLNQQIKEIDQQTKDAVKPLSAQLEALKIVNAVRLQAIAAEEAQINASVQPLREQLQAMRAEAATRLQAIEAEEVQVRTTLQTTIAGLMSQQDGTIQSFREEATGWLRAIRNEAMVRLEQAVREGDAEIARLLGLPPPLDPRLTQASQGLMALAQLAQGGGLPDIATSLATSSRFIGQGQLPDALTAAMRALAQAQGTPALQTGIGPEIISRFSSIIRDTQTGLYDPAIASLNNLVQLLRNAGLGVAPVPGFAAGLEYVPSDNFPARLHRGERVLTAEENQAYSGNKRGGEVTIHFSPTVQIEMTGRESPDVIRRKIDEATATLLVTPSQTRKALVRFIKEHRG